MKVQQCVKIALRKSNAFWSKDKQILIVAFKTMLIRRRERNPNYVKGCPLEAETGRFVICMVKLKQTSLVSTFDS